MGNKAGLFRIIRRKIIPEFQAHGLILDHDPVPEPGFETVGNPVVVCPEPQGVTVPEFQQELIVSIDDKG